MTYIHAGFIHIEGGWLAVTIARVILRWSDSIPEPMLTLLIAYSQPRTKWSIEYQGNMVGLESFV